MPEKGLMLCRIETWADTIICELECERGYVPKNQRKQRVFCGPTTGYVWTHVHDARNSYPRISGCERKKYEK